VDIKQLIPKPCVQARYEIYQTAYLELSECGIISPKHHTSTDVDGIQKGDAECKSPNTMLDEDDFHAVGDRLSPSHDLVQGQFGIGKDLLPRLWDIAEKSEVCGGKSVNIQEY